MNHEANDVQRMLSLSVAEAGKLLMNDMRPVTDISYCHRLHKVTRVWVSYTGDARSRSLYQKLAPNRTQLYLVKVTCTGNFQTQPTSQTTQILSRASVHVSSTSFLSVCHRCYTVCVPSWCL